MRFLIHGDCDWCLCVFIIIANYRLLDLAHLSLQDQFVAQVELVVKKKMKVKITRNEGWFSELELKNELKWTTSGTQKVCQMILTDFILSCALQFTQGLFQLVGVTAKDEDPGGEEGV